MYKKPFTLIFIALYLFILIFRLNSPRLFVYDEAIYAQSVQTMVFGAIDPNNHPLLAKTIWLIPVKLSWITLHKDYPFFWRIGSVLMALASLITFYKICQLLFDKKVAYLATAILALDPLFFTFGRTLHLEVPSMLFFLLALYGVLVFQLQKKISYLLAAAATLGLSLAAKISPLILFFPIQVAAALDLKDRVLSLKIIAVLAALVGLAYIFGNSYYFALNHSRSFTDYTIGLFYTFISGKRTQAQLQELQVQTSNPITWYLLPQAVRGYQRTFPEGQVVEFPFQNPLTAFMLLPSLAILLWKWRHLNSAQKTIIYAFATIYGAYFINIRETYYYYTVQLLPLVILLEILALSQILKSANLHKLLSKAFFVSAVILFIAYPIVAGLPAPKAYSKMLQQYFIYHPGQHNTMNCEEC